jgi:hypothetical protein
LSFTINLSSVLSLMSTSILEISVTNEPDKRKIKRFKKGNVTHFYNEIKLVIKDIAGYNTSRIDFSGT